MKRNRHIYKQINAIMYYGWCNLACIKLQVTKKSTQTDFKKLKISLPFSSLFPFSTSFASHYAVPPNVGLKRWNLLKKNCVFTLTCLNFSHLQSIPCWEPPCLVSEAITPHG